MMKYFILMSVVIVIRLGRVDGLTSLEAYDCVHPLSQLTTVALDHVEECNIPKPNMISESVVNVQLLQDQEYREIEVYSCRMSVTRSIFHCGMHHHSSVVKNPIVSYIKTLGRLACIDAIKSGMIVWNGHKLVELSVNNEHHRLITLAGVLSVEGGCKGGSWSDQFGSYNDVTVSGDVKILLQRSASKVSIRTQEVITSSGVRCTWKNGECKDSEVGEMYWDLKEHEECNRRSYDVLYQGEAKLSVFAEVGSSVHKRYIHIDNNKKNFVSELLSMKFACHQKVTRTEHPRLYVLEYVLENELYFQEGVISASNIDWMTYTNAKMVFIEQHIKRNMIDLKQAMEEETCRLERLILQNRIGLAKVNPNDYGNIYQEERGYMSFVSGEVIHVMKCQKVLVSTRQPNACFIELPVNYTGKEMFVHPFSRTLVEHGTEIPCSSLAPAVWHLGRHWISLDPHPRKTNKPEVMAPQSQIEWRYESLEELSMSGIYTTDQLSSVRESMMFANTRRAIGSILTSQIQGREVDLQGFHMNNMISPDYIHESLKEYLGWFASLFYSLGVYGSAFLTCYYIYVLCDKLITWALNAHIVMREKGCSLWLCTIPFTTILTLFSWFDKKSLLQQGKKNDLLHEETRETSWQDNVEDEDPNQGENLRTEARIRIVSGEEPQVRFHQASTVGYTKMASAPNDIDSGNENEEEVPHGVSDNVIITDEGAITLGTGVNPYGQVVPPFHSNQTPFTGGYNSSAKY